MYASEQDSFDNAAPVIKMIMEHELKTHPKMSAAKKKEWKKAIGILKDKKNKKEV